jgi:hypothetical protein
VGKNKPFSLLKEEKVGGYIGRLGDFNGSSEKMDLEA